MNVTARIVGNDEGDVSCSCCGRRDWYRAVQLVALEKDVSLTMVVCQRRYEGDSCYALAALAVDASPNGERDDRP